MSVTITKDGRTIRTHADYTNFRKALYASQDGFCGWCRRSTDLDAELECDWAFHVDHTKGRGGGKRDDSFEACVGACGKCHRIKHGQQSAVESKPQWSVKNV
jgi:hypothetical protein